MNPEIFAEWLRRQGHHVVRTTSSYWYDAGPRVFQAFPYHWVIEPSETELRRLILENNGIALRYSAPFSAVHGKVSYHVVCDDPGYDLSSLPRQARQNVKRGLKRARIEPIPLNRLAHEGWIIRQETLQRQGRSGAETEEWWHRLCFSAQDLPGFEAWGAMIDGQLVASFLAFKCEDYYKLLLEQSATAHLESRVNNAIFYSVTNKVFKRNGISHVFYGLHSLDAPERLDQFKFRMGYTPRPVRQRVIFHPLLAPLFNKHTYTIVRRLLVNRPNNPSLPKVEGMLRFCLEGKRPPTEQDWPKCLVSRKIELLEALKEFRNGS